MENKEVPRQWVVSPEGLYEASNKKKVRLIDVRRVALYGRSHASDALSLPLSKLMTWVGQKAVLPRREEVDVLMAGIGAAHDDWLVLYDDHQGLHASRAAWTLEQFGYWNVSILDRDFSKLAKTELLSSTPTEEGQPPAKAQAEGHMINSDELLSTIGKVDAKIIDCREPNLFPVGHIPGARNLPWYLLSGHGLNFLGPEEIRINTGYLQLRGKRAVVYCSSALNSAHTYVALRSAGMADVRVYAATFGEWVSRGAPVERGWQTGELEAEQPQ